MALRTCKYAPVPADVIEQIESLRKKDKPSEAELWALYRKALKEVLYYSYRLDYNYIDDSGISQGDQARAAIERAWRELPEELKIYIGSKQELIACAKAMNYSELSYERARFTKTFPLLEKRVEDRRIFLEFQNFLLTEENH